MQPIHDLHAWTIIRGPIVVSAHVVMGPDGDFGRLSDHLRDGPSGDFDIDQWTFQLETPEYVPWDSRAGRVQV